MGLVLALVVVAGIKSPRLMIIRDGNILKLHLLNIKVGCSLFHYPEPTMCHVSVIGRPECYQEIHLAVLNVPEYSDTPTKRD